MKLAGVLIALMVVAALVGAWIYSKGFEDPRPSKPKDAVVHTDPDGTMAYYSKDMDVRYGKVEDFRD